MISYVVGREVKEPDSSSELFEEYLTSVGSGTALPGYFARASGYPSERFEQHGTPEWAWRVLLPHPLVGIDPDTGFLQRDMTGILLPQVNVWTDSASAKIEVGRGGEVSAFFSGKIDLDVLAAQQGVSPVTNFDELLGDFWPEDESVDEFIATVREWRREGS